MIILINLTLWNITLGSGVVCIEAANNMVVFVFIKNVLITQMREDRWVKSNVGCYLLVRSALGYYIETLAYIFLYYVIEILNNFFYIV